MTTALAAAPSQIVTGIPQLRGERCTAIQDSDGTWCVKRLAIFATVDAGAKGNEKEIDEAWLRDCVETMQARYHADRQYIAPTHVYHHDQATEDAGYFVPVEVGPYHFSDGTTRPAIYADLFKVPDSVYQRIRANRLAFRSVEIIKYAERELGSLALMKDEVPFHRFALTTIGEEIKNTPADIYAAASLVQTIRGKKLAVHLFRFGGSMADEKDKPKKDGPPQAEGEHREPDGDEDGEGSDNAKDPVDVEAGQNQMAASLTQGLAEIKAMLTAVFSLLSGAGGAMAGTGNPSNLAPVKPVGQMSQEAEATFQAREADLAKREADFSARETALNARLGAVEAVLKAQGDSAASEKRYSEGMAALDGRFVPEPLKAELRKLASGPDATFKSTLEIIKTTLPYDPPTYRDGTVQAAASDVSAMPEEVQKAVAAGQGEDAIRQYRAYEAHMKFHPLTGADKKTRTFAEFQKVEAIRNAHLETKTGRG